MDTNLITRLICPFCEERLVPETSDLANRGFASGFLACSCGRYPVLAGIPVLKKDLPKPVIDFVQKREWNEAMTAMVLSENSEHFVQRTGRPGLENTVACRDYERNVRKIIDSKEFPSIRQMLMAFAPFEEFGKYLYYKHAQPRDLVSISLAELIAEQDDLIMDLGCGAGYSTRHLQRRGREKTVVGIDRYFSLLYCAKRLISPESHYICCNVEAPLPFRDDLFSCLYSLDSFHNVRAKRNCVREMRRVGKSDALFCVGSVRNALVNHAYNDEFVSPELFGRLMDGLPCRIIDDSTIVDRYLQKQLVDLTQSESSDKLQRVELMTAVSSIRSDIFRDYGVFQEWPHAKGKLGVNPLYKVCSKTSLGVCLRMRFPSLHYKAENGRMADYMPATAEIPRVQYDLLAEGKPLEFTEEFSKLIEGFVVMSLPGAEISPDVA